MLHVPQQCVGLRAAPSCWAGPCCCRTVLLDMGFAVHPGFGPGSPSRSELSGVVMRVLLRRCQGVKCNGCVVGLVLLPQLPRHMSFRFLEFVCGLPPGCLGIARVIANAAVAVHHQADFVASKHCSFCCTQPAGIACVAVLYSTLAAHHSAVAVTGHGEVCHLVWVCPKDTIKILSVHRCSKGGWAPCTQCNPPAVDVSGVDDVVSCRVWVHMRSC